MASTKGRPAASRALGRVGVWGAPSSGKTTFLAALNIAVSRSPTDDLMIYGTDDSSTEFLVENTERLTKDRSFPEATQGGQQLSWVVHMNTEVPVKSRLPWARRAVVPLELNLDLLDEPGRVFADAGGESTGGAAGGGAALGFDDDDDEMLGTGSPEETVMDELAGCHGLLLLFDPTREWKAGDAYNYFQGTLLRIAQRRMPDRARPGGRLPHYVAVCATKFDHPDVYSRAKRHGYRSFSADDQYLFPRVADELAEQFFTDLVLESDVGNADLVPNALRRYFYPERVRFFVTSAIGFYMSRKASRFQEQNFMNTVPQSDGTSLIRGAIHPINVVEPLIWLGKSLAADSEK